TTSPTARTGSEGRAEGDQTGGRPRPSLRMNVTTTNRVEGSMASFSSNGTDANANSEHLVLDELSEALRISKQTLVSWTDRGLIDASLDWGLSDANEELRLIHISPASLDFLRGFADEYRNDTVTRTEARRLLKLI